MCGTVYVVAHYDEARWKNAMPEKGKPDFTSHESGGESYNAFQGTPEVFKLFGIEDIYNGNDIEWYTNERKTNA